MIAPWRRITRDRPRRFVLLLAAIGLAPLLLVGFVGVQLSSDAARSQARRQVGAAAAASAVAVRQEMSGLADVVQAFATRPSLIDAVQGDAPGSTGTELALRGLLDARPGVELAFVADPAGTLIDILPSTPEIIGRDFSFRDWYRGATRTQQAYVSEVYETAARGGGLVVAAAAPIWDAGRPGTRMIGILVAAYRLDTLQDFVDGFGRLQGVSLAVTDQRGVVLAETGEPVSAVTSRRNHPAVAAALAGRSASGEAERDGEQLVSAYAPVEGLGWALTAEVPQAVALRDIGAVRGAMLGLTALLAVALLVALAFVDRTLRRQAAVEDELRRSQAFLDSVIENIPHMVVVKDAEELRVVRLNRAGEALLGRARDGILGRNDHDLHPPEEADARRRADRAVLESADAIQVFTEPIQTIEGATRLLHTKKIPIRDEDGRPEYLLGISEDITDRQAAEAALEEARRAADDANQAKSRFLSRMSHELRTPLNAVLGFSQLLALDELTDAQRESLHHITEAGRHLLGLIDEILDISRIESGGLRLSLEPVSLRDVVDGALVMVETLAADRQVDVGAQLPVGDLHVHADRQRLQQVLVNLLSNAVKYNREGGTVRVSADLITDDRVRVEVVDTGIGIAQQDLARLFTPFDRLGAEASEVDGTGLGLTLTKELVEVMGGEIGATSLPGVGTSFWVELPVTERPTERSDGELGDGRTPPAPTSDVEVAELTAPVRTILYVEDNISNVRLVERIVARRPAVTLVVAMAGRAALDLAKEHDFHLVLLDLHLPDVPGEEVLRRLRAEPRTASAPVVILSADVSPGQVERLIANGATDYLSKPFDVSRLLALIDGTTAYPDQPAGADPPGDDGPLDPSIISSLRTLDDDDGSLAELVELFLTTSAVTCTELGDALDAGDAAAVVSLAHRLVGSSANFGARHLAAVLREIEAHAKAGALAEARAQRGRLDSSFAEARDALRAALLSDPRTGQPGPL